MLVRDIATTPTISSWYLYSGLKNAFRLEVMKAREAQGLDAHVTNAPKEQMQKVDLSVVR